MQSRQALKEHLRRTVPEGAEGEYLREAEEKLRELQAQLQQLQERRGGLRRQITIRERKLVDWKSKIPRAVDVLPPMNEIAECVSTSRAAACHEVARISQVKTEEGVTTATLSVLTHFKTGLKGLAGFEKAWLVLAIGEAVHGKMSHDASGNASRHMGPDFSPTSSTVSLVLVDVIDCDEREGKLGIALVPTSNDSCGDHSLHGAVIDIKPYINYCDSA